MGGYRLDWIQLPGSGLTYVPQIVRHPQPRAKVQQEHYAPNAQKYQHREFIESFHRMQYNAYLYDWKDNDQFEGFTAVYLHWGLKIHQNEE